MLAGAAIEAEASSSTKISVTSSNHSRRSVLDCVYSYFVLLLDLAWIHLALSLAIPMFEDELVDELEGPLVKPRTTMGT